MFKKFTIVLFAILVLNSKGYSQEKIEISAGIGFTDGPNIGTAYHINRFAFEFKLGSYEPSRLKYDHAYVYTFGARYYTSKLKGEEASRKWYVEALGSKSEYNKDSGGSILDLNGISLTARYGRDIYLGKHTGFSMSLGITSLPGWGYPFPNGEFNFFHHFEL